MHQLAAGDADVKRLVLEILVQEWEHQGDGRVQPFVQLIVPQLRDFDRLVRMTAIQAVRDLQLREAIPGLRRIVCEDEKLLAAEALAALIEMDESLLDDLIQFVRTKQG